MDRRSKLALLLPWLALLGSCGYFRAGSWEDDPKNWTRAFHSTKPSHVIVLHSKYSRNAHWSQEFEYFFVIEANATLREQLFRENELRRIESGEAPIHSDHRPTWFLPGSWDRYGMWAYAGEPSSNFRAFIDEETGDLFLTDNQI